MDRGRHTARAGLLMLVGVSLAGCKTMGAYVPEAPSRSDLSTEVVRLSDGGTPPEVADGVCWQSDITPMVIETVSEQIQEAPEQRDEAGNITRPAVFRTETSQRIVNEREEVWFRTPCPEAFTVDFIASLQRALKARGFYLAPLTGEMDGATKEAIHRFQTTRGLDSQVLTLATAQELGLIAVDQADL